MICYNCKNTINDSMRFCPFCGTEQNKRMLEETIHQKAKWMNLGDKKFEDFVFFREKVFDGVDFKGFGDCCYKYIHLESPELTLGFHNITIDAVKGKQYGLKSPYATLDRKQYLPHFINELIKDSESKCLKKNTLIWDEKSKDEFYEDYKIYPLVTIYTKNSRKNEDGITIRTETLSALNKYGEEKTIDIMSICSFDVTNDGTILINDQFFAYNDEFTKKNDIYELEGFVRRIILLLQLIHTAGLKNRNIPLYHWRKSDPSEYVIIDRDGFPVLDVKAIDGLADENLDMMFKKYCEQQKNMNYISVIVEFALSRFPAIQYLTKQGIEGLKKEYGPNGATEFFAEMGVSNSEKVLSFTMDQSGNGLVLGAQFIYILKSNDEDFMIRRIKWDDFKNTKLASTSQTRSTVLTIDTTPKIEITFENKDKLGEQIVSFLDFIHKLLNQHDAIKVNLLKESVEANKSISKISNGALPKKENLEEVKEKAISYLRQGEKIRAIQVVTNSGYALDLMMAKALVEEFEMELEANDGMRISASSNSALFSEEERNLSQEECRNIVVELFTKYKPAWTCVIEEKEFEKKLPKARNTYASYSSLECPLVLYDPTVLGSAKEGFVLTDKKIYINRSDCKKAIFIDVITGAFNTKDDVYLQTKTGDAHIASYASKKQAEKLVDFIVSYINAIKAK